MNAFTILFACEADDPVAGSLVGELRDAGIEAVVVPAERPPESLPAWVARPAAVAYYVEVRLRDLPRARFLAERILLPPGQLCPPRIG